MVLVDPCPVAEQVDHQRLLRYPGFGHGAPEACCRLSRTYLLSVHASDIAPFTRVQGKYVVDVADSNGKCKAVRDSDPFGSVGLSAQLGKKRSGSERGLAL